MASGRIWVNLDSRNPTAGHSPYKNSCSVETHFSSVIPINYEAAPYFARPAYAGRAKYGAASHKNGMSNQGNVRFMLYTSTIAGFESLLL
jgi:hypothetical protein